MAGSLPNTPEYSVSELSLAIKRSLEEGFSYVRIRGEISGYRGPHSSGHCYFALKDDKAKIEAVIWKGVMGRFKIKPEEGMEVLVIGRVSSFPSASKYQIIIEQLEPAGIGALMALLDERKRRLAAEGLFEEARKKPLPFFPRVVGIVTSPTGAVIRDMLHGFTERCPTHVVLWPVRVQGEGSADEIAAAIRGFNLCKSRDIFPLPDVIIVARGGGSLEDLWSFNEEIVVRAAAESEIPLISAVGHETDWTLLDLAADARAPTPTKAAEWAVPKFSELIKNVSDCKSHLRIGILRVLDSLRSDLKSLVRGLPRPAELIIIPRQRFDAVDQRLPRGLISNTKAHVLVFSKISSRISRHLLENILSKHQTSLIQNSDRKRRAFLNLNKQRRNHHEALQARLRLENLKNIHVLKRLTLNTYSKLLSSLSFQGILQRGFAIVRDNTGKMVRMVQTMKLGQNLELQFMDGIADVEVKRLPASLPKGNIKGNLKKNPGEGSSQGSLF